MNHIALEAPLQPNFTSGGSRVKSGDDIVVVCALRTPICKAKKGALKDTHWTDLLTAALKGVVEKSGLPAKDIEDVQVGTVLAAGGGATEARMAMFAAGYPETACLATTNRQCSSGLQAFVNIAHAIRSGQIKIGVAAGVESMSLHGFASGIGNLNDNLMKNKEAADCLVPMGITSENVAEAFNISRQIQDEFAANSQIKAAKAQKAGLFKDEIIPVHTTTTNDKGETQSITVEHDDGIRATTPADLAKLRPAFKKDGTTTAGNSSQVSDGAAAVLVMTRAEAERRHLPILGRYVSSAVAGVPPHIMGVGPAYAIPGALARAGLKVEDIDVYEINEAFASQAYYSITKLGIPLAKVNPLGGAIALGHPLGCTGARMIATLFHQLRRTKQRYGVVSMCIGTGMGMAAVFEAE
uniref:acetyl-CoA C-acyltransferase n=1 Tax=Arcella intermedia TaxID=1963864 RepID=A0A6B2L573_9EUKA